MLKGFEVEVFTGTADGEVVGLSDRIVEKLDGFVREPDSRNVEFITPPLEDYGELLVHLVEPRRRLRRALADMGPYLIVPGSTMPLAGATRQFFRSHPGNTYHDRIEQTYGTTVVTASIHINFGIDDAEQVVAACRMLRMDAAAVLALSASSPFLEGAASGSHSTRWTTFPQTPPHVPLFRDHAHYIAWVEEKLAEGVMWNVRHLWSAVRPNGPQRPHQIDRVELRVCDVILDPRVLLGLTNLLEGRLRRLLDGDRSLDPLHSASYTLEEMADLAHRNEMAAAARSLDAVLIDWRSGQEVTARRCLERMLADADGGPLPLKVEEVLRQGNEAMRWLELYRGCQNVQQVVRQAIQECAELEEQLARQVLPEI